MGYNVSAAGTTVVVNGTNITDFADDVAPVTVSDVEVGNGEKSFSGAMLVWGVEKSVKIEISVIPDSQSDYELYNLAKEEKSSIDTDHSYEGFSIVIEQNGKTKGTYNGCIFASIPAGDVLATSGRKNGRKYTFIGDEANRGVEQKGQQVAMIWNAETSPSRNMA